ncbi:hypothetical protein Hanom_Chr08g00722681 [Helianthus anomalus]
MIEKYQSCKKELESTQITCKKWVKSCLGYKMLLENQIKSNVKFGVGFRKHDNNPCSTENTHIEAQMVEMKPANSNGEEIKITELSGKMITIEKPQSSIQTEKKNMDLSQHGLGLMNVMFLKLQTC